MEGHHLLAGDPVGLELSPLRLEGVLQGLVEDDVDALDFQVDSRIWTKVLKSIKDSKVVGFLLFKTTSEKLPCMMSLKVSFREKRT